jgi:hypothetical protein
VIAKTLPKQQVTKKLKQRRIFKALVGKVGCSFRTANLFFSLPIFNNLQTLLKIFILVKLSAGGDHFEKNTYFRNVF